MSWPVKTISVDTTFNDAAVLFKRHGVRHYLVVDGRSGRLSRHLSQSDIVLNQGAEFFSSSSIWTPSRRQKPAAGDRCRHALHEAISCMREQHVEALLVRYPDSDYGILTQRDVVRLLAENRAPAGGRGGQPSHHQCAQANQPVLRAQACWRKTHPPPGRAGPRRTGWGDQFSDIPHQHRTRIRQSSCNTR